MTMVAIMVGTIITSFGRLPQGLKRIDHLNGVITEVAIDR